MRQKNSSKNYVEKNQKGTNWKEQEPKRAQTKKSKNQKQQEPKTAGTKNSTNQKGQEPKSGYLWKIAIFQPKYNSFFTWELRLNKWQQFDWNMIVNIFSVPEKESVT